MDLNVSIERVPLYKIASPVKREIRVEPDNEYRTLGCRLYGEGIYQRESKLGAIIKAKKLYVVKENDFVINRIWAQKGSVGIVNAEIDGSVVTADFPVFTLDTTKILPSYTSWYIKTKDFWDECKKHSRGTSGRQRLNPKEVQNITFPLFELKEQQRIVNYIEELVIKMNQAIKLQLLVQKNLQNYFISQYNIFFANNKENWKQLFIEDICETMIDYRGRTPPLTEEGIPHITSANIRNGEIDWNTKKFVSQETYDEYMTRGIPKKDDVFLTMEAPLGETAVLTENKKFSVAQRVLLLRPKLGVISGDYLASVLMCAEVQNKIKKKSTHTTVQGISSKRLRKIILPIPPIKEQILIVSKVNNLRKITRKCKTVINQSLDNFEKLLPSILETAFSGKVKN